MIANYHTHTYRCGHATGTEREYIERAIENGIKIMGFSDHAPFLFPDGYESGYRVPTALAEDYINTLKALREEYKDKIEILIGFEMEYYPLHFKEMLKYVKELGAEYLILGQHFVDNETRTEKFPYGKHTTGNKNTAEELSEFADYVIAAIKSGVFSYIAHPDIFNYDTEAPEYEREMRRICKTAAEYGMPLEINFLGLRTNRHYPAMKFWEIAGEEGCTAVFGFDAHDTMAAYDGDSLITANRMIEKYGLKLIETVNIKRI
ncbi:MAG: histidinol-phosphatase [Clostridia bacterium]|nr:histidinol-phosphatase [Clostridia bacterium]